MSSVGCIGPLRTSTSTQKEKDDCYSDVILVVSPSSNPSVCSLVGTMRACWYLDLTLSRLHVYSVYKHLTEVYINNSIVRLRQFITRSIFPSLVWFITGQSCLQQFVSSRPSPRQMRPKYLRRMTTLHTLHWHWLLIIQTWTVSVETMTLAPAQPGRLTVGLGREELIRDGPVLAIIPGASANQFI